MELNNIVYRTSESINQDISYELSALVNADSFFYGLLDYGTKLKAAYGIKHNDAPFSDMVHGQPYKIRKTKIGIHNNLFTIVPDKEFSVKHSFDWLSQVCQLEHPEDYIIRNDYSDQFKLRVIYAVPKPLMRDIKESVENCSLVHFVFACLDSIPNVGPQIKVRVVILDTHFVLVVKRGNGLLLANSYDYTSWQDILYFLSLAYDKLGLNRLEDPIELSGMIKSDDTLISLLVDYFGKVQLASNYLNIDQSQSVSEHHFLPLYCISKCA